MLTCLFCRSKDYERAVVVKAKVNETNKIFRVNGVVRSREKKGKKIQKKAKKRLDRADIVRDAW